MLSIFYTRKEIAPRISILYTGNILATAFAGLIALGIFELDGKAGLKGWRWLFIIQVCRFTLASLPVIFLTDIWQGIATFVIALGAVFTLPDHPLSPTW